MTSQKGDHIKLSFLTTEETACRLPADGRNHQPHNRSKTATQELQSSRSLKQSVQKRTGVTNRHVSKDEIQMASRHGKKCVASLAISKIQIKTTMAFYLTPDRMATAWKSNTTCWHRCGRKGALSAAGGSASQRDHCGRQYGQSFEV